jgi:hypothetical protein
MAKTQDTSDTNDGGLGKARRRQRGAPLPVILRFRTNLKPNDMHPLAELEPAVRGEQREKIMASILARLANGGSAVPPAVDTMPKGVLPTARTPSQSESG